MALVESDPPTVLTLDLRPRQSSGRRDGAGDDLDSIRRRAESFLEGTWDATGMLLDRFEEVEAVAGAAAVRDRLDAERNASPLKRDAWRKAWRRSRSGVRGTLPGQLDARLRTVSRNASAACDNSPPRR